MYHQHVHHLVVLQPSACNTSSPAGREVSAGQLARPGLVWPGLAGQVLPATFIVAGAGGGGVGPSTTTLPHPKDVGINEHLAEGEGREEGTRDLLLVRV